jgi:hypothetical protein
MCGFVYVMGTGSEGAVGEGIASCLDRSSRLTMVVHGACDSCRRAALHPPQMAPNHGCERLVAKQPGSRGTQLLGDHL